MKSIPDRLKRLVTRFYDLGEVTDYRPISRGQVNTGHVIETKLSRKRPRYFVREYRQGREIADIEFEHALINHLVSKKFEYICGVVMSTTGQTYAQLPDDEAGESHPVFFAVFDYLPGEIRYDWSRPDCKVEELKSAATTLARYHEAVADWWPVNGGARPGIAEQLLVTEKQLQEYRQLAGNARFDDCLSNGLDLITRSHSDTLDALSSSDYHQIPRLAVHGDFHPGNLIFRNGHVSGLFDFDWANMDVRCFDVALAVFYFCTEWRGSVDGHLNIDRASVFLHVYQNTLKTNRAIETLSETERRFLPDMILAANIYVLGWILSDFYRGNVDNLQYTGYLRHGLNFIRWESANSRWSEQIFKSTA